MAHQLLREMVVLALLLPSMAQSQLMLVAVVLALMAALLERAVWVAVQMEAIATHNLLVQLPIQVVVEVVAVGFQALVMVALVALALLSFAIQLHTLMQLHTHQLLKQQQTGIRFIPSLPLEQSPSKE
jgi:hypothetical protein